MNQGTVSHAAGHFNFLKFTKFSLPITTTRFNSHLQNLSFSLKTQSGCFPKSPIKALYAAEAESFYDLLGIPENVTPGEIKQAYKKLVLKCHPDLSPPECTEENTKKFIRLQEAYETLSDPKSRALYDSDLLYNQWLDEKGEWRIQWQAQLAELKKRSMNNEDSSDNLSWGARIRRQRSKARLDHERKLN